MRRAVAIAAALALALAAGACGESPEDDAYEDGKRMGESVRALFDAPDLDDAQSALNGIRASVDEAADETKDHVSDQIDTQRGSLEKAAEAASSGDLQDLKAEVQQVASQADSFRNGNDSITNAFWRGFEDGYDAD